MLRLATLSVNAPGTLNASSSADGLLIACSAFSRSIWMSKVPTIPVSCALTEPKLRLALSRPIATVSVRMPLLIDVSASVIEPPETVSGPRLNGLLVEPPSAFDAVIVKLALPRAFGAPPARPLVRDEGDVHLAGGQRAAEREAVRAPAHAASRS